MFEIHDFFYKRDQHHYRFDARAEASSLTLIRGNSGIGKSTLLDCIAGFLKPNNGRLSWNGKDFHHLAVHERPLSLLQQGNNLFPHLNVWENVCLGSGGLSKTGKKQALEVLERVGLSPIAEHKPNAISGGQAQRVGLARAILRHQYSPRPILLLDEPYSALDEDSTQTMHQLVRTLCQQHQLCVLLVAHRAVDCDQIWHVVAQDDKDNDAQNDEHNNEKGTAVIIQHAHARIPLEV